MLIMNSRIKQRWGHEEMVPLPEAMLRLTVRIDEAGYHVFDDRSPHEALHLYKHRQPWRPPTSLKFSDGWTLSCGGGNQSDATAAQLVGSAATALATAAAPLLARIPLQTRTCTAT